MLMLTTGMASFCHALWLIIECVDTVFLLIMNAENVKKNSSTGDSTRKIKNTSELTWHDNSVMGEILRCTNNNNNLTPGAGFAYESGWLCEPCGSVTKYSK